MISGLGDRLQMLRNEYKLSQKEVASAIGVSASIISNYESGERTPSAEVLVSLSRIYHCSTDYILGIEKSDTKIDVSKLNENQIRILRHFIDSL